MIKTGIHIVKLTISMYGCMGIDFLMRAGKSFSSGLDLTRQTSLVATLIHMVCAFLDSICHTANKSIICLYQCMGIEWVFTPHSFLIRGVWD